MIVKKKDAIGARKMDASNSQIKLVQSEIIHQSILTKHDQDGINSTLSLINPIKSSIDIKEDQLGEKGEKDSNPIQLEEKDSNLIQLEQDILSPIEIKSNGNNNFNHFNNTFRKDGYDPISKSLESCINIDPIPSLIGEIDTVESGKMKKMDIEIENNYSSLPNNEVLDFLSHLDAADNIDSRTNLACDLLLASTDTLAQLVIENRVLQIIQIWLEDRQSNSIGLTRVLLRVLQKVIALPSIELSQMINIHLSQTLKSLSQHQDEEIRSRAITFLPHFEKDQNPSKGSKINKDQTIQIQSNPSPPSPPSSLHLNEFKKIETGFKKKILNEWNEKELEIFKWNNLGHDPLLSPKRKITHLYDMDHYNHLYTDISTYDTQSSTISSSGSIPTILDDEISSIQSKRIHFDDDFYNPRTFNPSSLEFDSTQTDQILISVDDLKSNNLKSCLLRGSTPSESLNTDNDTLSCQIPSSPIPHSQSNNKKKKIVCWPDDSKIGQVEYFDKDTPVRPRKAPFHSRHFSPDLLGFTTVLNRGSNHDQLLSNENSSWEINSTFNPIIWQVPHRLSISLDENPSFGSQNITLTPAQEIENSREVRVPMVTYLNEDDIPLMPQDPIINDTAHQDEELNTHGNHDDSQAHILPLLPSKVLEIPLHLTPPIILPDPGSLQLTNIDLSFLSAAIQTTVQGSGLINPSVSNPSATNNHLNNIIPPPYPGQISTSHSLTPPHPPPHPSTYSSNTSTSIAHTNSMINLNGGGQANGQIDLVASMDPNHPIFNNFMDFSRSSGQSIPSGPIMSPPSPPIASNRINLDLYPKINESSSSHHHSPPSPPSHYHYLNPIGGAGSTTTGPNSQLIDYLAPSGPTSQLIDYLHQQECLNGQNNQNPSTSNHPNFTPIQQTPYLQNGGRYLKNTLSSHPVLINSAFNLNPVDLDINLGGSGGSGGQLEESTSQPIFMLNPTEVVPTQFQIRRVQRKDDVDRHICKNWKKEGKCNFGHKCHFLHTMIRTSTGHYR